MGRLDCALEAFPLDPLALELASPAHGLGLLPGAFFGWLFVRPTSLHFTKDPFALHFLFQRFQGLVDVVVTNDHLHEESFSFSMG